MKNRMTKWNAMTTGWMVQNQIHSRLIEGKKWYDFHTEIEFKRLYRKALSFAGITEHEDSQMHKARSNNGKNKKKDKLWIRQVVKDAIEYESHIV